MSEFRYTLKAKYISCRYLLTIVYYVCRPCQSSLSMTKRVKTRLGNIWRCRAMKWSKKSPTQIGSQTISFLTKFSLESSVIGCFTSDRICIPQAARVLPHFYWASNKLALAFFQRKAESFLDGTKTLLFPHSCPIRRLMFFPNSFIIILQSWPI